MCKNTKEYSDFLYSEMMKLEEFFQKIKEQKKKNDPATPKDEKIFFE